MRLPACVSSSLFRSSIISFIHYPVWGWVFVGWIAVDLALNRADFTSKRGEFIEDAGEK
jgi:hypothetical protein